MLSTNPLRTETRLKDSHQLCHQGYIGWRHIQMLQFRQGHPFHIRRFQVLRFTPSNHDTYTIAAADASRPKLHWQRRQVSKRQSLLPVPTLLLIPAQAPFPGVSPDSTLPPGNSQSPAIGLPGGRFCTRILRSPSIRAAATTNRYVGLFSTFFCDVRILLIPFCETRIVRNLAEL